MQLSWVDTARGSALSICEEGRTVSLYPYELEDLDYAAATTAISLWEGIAGLRPQGRVAGWRWKRGLNKLRQSIIKEVTAFTTE